MGYNEKNIGDRVIQMRILNSEGRLITYDLSDEDNKITKAVRGHLGLFGIVYDMKLRVDNPMKIVSYENKWIKVKDIFYEPGGIQELLDENWAVSMMWFPFNSLAMAGRVGAFVQGFLQTGLWNPQQDEIWVHMINKGLYRKYS